MIRLRLPYPPSGNHTVKHAKGGHYLTDAVRVYRWQVAAAVLRAKARQQLTGPLCVTFTVYPPDLRARDSDNVEKTVKDALTKAGVWLDDSNKVIRRSLFDWREPVKGGEVVVTIETICEREAA